MSIHTYPKFTNMHNRKLKRCMNRQRLQYLHLKKKSLVYPDDLVKRTKFLENVRGSSNLNSQILGFLCTFTMLVLNVSVTYFEVRRNQIRNLTFFQTTESKKEVQNQAKFHVAQGKKVVFCKLFTSARNYECYCNLTHPNMLKVQRLAPAR